MLKLSLICLLLLILLQFHTATSYEDAFEIIASIYKDKDGLYVEAYHYDYDRRKIINPSVRTMLSFSSNETILASSCLYFDPFSCAPGTNCKQISTDKITTMTPYMDIKGSRATATLMLTIAGWTLKSSAILASECSASIYKFGEGRRGIIGLGTEGSSSENFIGPKLFSIFLNQDNITKENDLMGHIAFGFFPAPYMTTPTSVFPADANWQIHFSNASLHIAGKTLQIPAGKVLFDLHSDAIAVPLAVFDTIVERFKNATGKPCSPSKYRPVCYLPVENGKANKEKLPDLDFELNIGGKSYNLTLNYFMYIREYEITGDNVTLNLKDNRDTNSVRSSFADAIILDSRVMYYYEAVFNYTQGTNQVELYLSRTPPSPKTESDSFLGEFGKVVAVVSGVIILGSVLVYFVISRKSKNLKKELREPLQEEIHF